MAQATARHDTSWIILEVDGVLVVPWRHDWAETRLPDGDHVRVSPDAPKIVQRLQALGDVHWQTSWGDRANDALAPTIGLPRLPQVPWEQSDDETFWRVDPRYARLDGLEQYIQRRGHNGPVIWIEDGFTRRQQKWAHDRGQTLLLDTAETGIDWSHVTTIERWLRTIDTPSEPTQLRPVSHLSADFYTPCETAAPIRMVEDVTERHYVLECGHSFPTDHQIVYKIGQRRRCYVCQRAASLARQTARRIAS